MFHNCSSLQYLAINFNTTKVTNMEKMFFSCKSLTTLNLSSFDTHTCSNFNNMFENNIYLEIYINRTKCANLIEKLPDYIYIHDINE